MCISMSVLWNIRISKTACLEQANYGIFPEKEEDGLLLMYINHARIMDEYCQQWVVFPFNIRYFQVSKVTLGIFEISFQELIHVLGPR